VTRYIWLMIPAYRPQLEAAGWREVARHRWYGTPLMEQTEPTPSASRPESGLRAERSEPGGDRAAEGLTVPIGDTFKSSQEARDAG
jgi:hypothetical protein